MTFLQCVYGVYDEKMESVYGKYSQNDSIYVDSESTFYKTGGNENGISKHFWMEQEKGSTGKYRMRNSVWSRRQASCETDSMWDCMWSIG